MSIRRLLTTNKVVGIFFVSVLVVIKGFLFCANFYEFDFLNIPSGVRATGMGENFVSMENSSEGIFYNPAVVTTNPYGEFLLSHNLYYVQSFVDDLVLTLPFKRWGLGVVGRYFSTSDIPKIENYQEVGSFGMKSYYGGLKLGVKVCDWLAIGVGGKYVTEGMDYIKSTYLYDSGLVLKTYSGVFSFSATLENYNSDSQYNVASFYNCGFSLKLDLPQQASKINFLLGVKIDTKSLKEVYSAGIEHWGSDILGIRLGYIYDKEKSDLGIFEPITFFRGGISLRIGKFCIDYAYSPNNNVCTTHNIGLSYRFKEIKKDKVIVKQKASLEVEPRYFSPNRDGYKDNIFFIHNATTTYGNVEGCFTIKDKNKAVVSSLIFSTHTRKVDSLFVFNGESLDKGVTLPDGYYFVSLLLKDKQNEKEVIYGTSEEEFVVDTTPPIVEISFSADVISPDGDYINDKLESQVKVIDALSPIESLNVKIYTLGNKQVKNYNIDISSQESREVSIDVVWDCKDDLYGKIVPNGEYKMVVSGKDFAGNRILEEKLFTVYVPQKKEKEEVVIEKIFYIRNAKVRVEERGIVISYLTDELFVKGSGEISSKMYDSLNSLADIIKEKYKDKKILIEGHTDSVGEESINLEKSSKYAWKVFSYLVKECLLNKDNIEVKGYGETRPIASNKTRAGRMQNRRVEIIIPQN